MTDDLSGASGLPSVLLEGEALKMSERYGRFVVKNRVTPKWFICKWKYGLKPAVPESRILTHTYVLGRNQRDWALASFLYLLGVAATDFKKHGEIPCWRSP